MSKRKEYKEQQERISINHFTFSVDTLPALEEKIELQHFEYLLNSANLLVEYSTLNQFNFHLIVLPQVPFGQENRIAYQLEEQKLNIQYQLDWSLCKEANKHQILGWIADCFVSLVRVLPKMNIPTLKALELFEAIKDKFRQRGWIGNTIAFLDGIDVKLRWEMPYYGGPQFYFNAFLHPAVIEKFNLYQIPECLEENIHLKDFGKEITRIQFTCLADDPQDSIEGAAIDYVEEHLQVAILLPISYPGLLVMDAPYNRRLLVQLFLLSVKYFDHLPLKDFDSHGFYLAIKGVFWEKGWIG